MDDQISILCGNYSFFFVFVTSLGATSGQNGIRIFVSFIYCLETVKLKNTEKSLKKGS